MKRIAVLGLIIMTGVMLAACSSKDDKKDDEAEKVQDTISEEVKVEEDNDEKDASDEDTGGADGVSVLSTDDKSISITILRPEGFEDSEYSSEYQVSFQRPGTDDTGSTELNLRLMSVDENTVMATAQQEVEYLLSANSDGMGNVSEVQSQTVGDRQWSYFTYSMDGVEGYREGYRIWTSLANGCVLSCIVENLGSGLEPLSVDDLLQTLNASIAEGEN